MKKIVAFFRSVASSPKNDLDKLADDITTLQRVVNYLPADPVAITRMISLCDAVSALQDKNLIGETIASLERKNFGQLDGVIGALKELELHVTNAGRSVDGHNRAKPGERVTADNLYLGGVFELDNHPASYWLENRKKLEQTTRKDLKRLGGGSVSNWWCINDYQADIFVISHSNGIKKTIKVILDY